MWMPLCFLEDQCFCFIFARVFVVFNSAQFVAGFSQPRKKKEILDFLCIFRMSYVQNIFAFSELLDQRIQICTTWFQVFGNSWTLAAAAGVVSWWKFSRSTIELDYLNLLAALVQEVNASYTICCLWCIMCSPILRTCTMRSQIYCHSVLLDVKFTLLGNSVQSGCLFFEPKIY